MARTETRDYRFTREPTTPASYRVTHKESGEQPGIVWTEDDGRTWNAILYKTGEQGQGRRTRTAAADWLWGRWSAQFGKAAKHVPADPFEGLPGARRS